jgi:transcriptional regulator with XRE-family HTH domain
MVSEMEGLGKRLKAARKEAGFTQAELAEKVGCRQQLISQIERGGVDHTTYYREFASVLKVDPAWLVTGKGSPKPNATQKTDEFSALADLLTQSQRDMLARWMKDLIASSSER